MTTTTTASTKPPGPKGKFLVGCLPAYSRDPLGFMTHCAKAYGDVVYLTGLLPTYLFNHPAAIEEMLVTQHPCMVKSQLTKISKPLLGNGLLLSEGDFWKQQRHLIQPAFHRHHIATYAQVMVSYTQRMLATWQPGDRRDIHHDMMQLTLAIAAKTFFGSDIQSDIAVIDHLASTMLENFDQRSQNLLLFVLPNSVPTPSNRRLRHAIQQIDALVYRLIEERRSSGEESDDLLSMLLSLRTEDGQSMGDRQIRDEITTFLLAGHETTALVLTWAWYLLSQHPKVEARLAEELKTVLAGQAPTLADLPQLRYTEWIVLETMRLYPPVWAIPRTVAEPCEIGGYLVKPGQSVVACPWVVHRDPRWYPDPEAFMPERWDNNFAKQLPSLAYFPFGGGPRICIGKAFAMMEATLVLATIASKYRLRRDSPQPVDPWPSLSLRPKQTIEVHLEAKNRNHSTAQGH